MKARIFLAQYYSDDNYDQTILRASLTNEWEEIDKEDIELVRKNLHKLNFYNDYSLSPVLVVLDEQPLANRVDAIKTLIAEEKKQQEIQKAKREAAKKAKLAKKANDEVERERLLFEELKKKFSKEK